MPRKSWWARLPFTVRMATGAGVLLLAIGGSVAGFSALARDEPAPVQAAARDLPVGPEVTTPPSKPAPPPVAKAGLGAQAGKHSRRGEAPAGHSPIADRAGRLDQADRTATRKPRKKPAAGKVVPGPHPSAAVPTAPAVTTRTVSETRPLPYQTQLVRDPSLPRGTRSVQEPGVVGEQTLRYVVTYTSGRETGRRLLDTTVTRQPQQRVVAFGARRGLGAGRWHDRPRECGLVDDACVPISRSALCADEPKADPAADAEPTDGASSPPGPVDPVEESGPQDDDLFLVDPADLAELELDPSVICD